MAKIPGMDTSRLRARQGVMVRIVALVEAAAMAVAVARSPEIRISRGIRGGIRRRLRTPARPRLPDVEELPSARHATKNPPKMGKIGALSEGTGFGLSSF